jgi:DNA-binding ferritin-like protein
MLEQLRKTNPNKFIGVLFSASIQLHIFHLQVQGKGSYATHMALKELYDVLPSYIDKIVESYQGLHGIIKDYKVDNPVNFITKEQVCKHVKELHEYVDNNRLTIFKDSDIINIIDELKNDIKSCLYKLENLE